ncbi:MAG: hypothetical protein KatS3mg088_387 [Patescibacteria group bacterium]|nr:MAG: hypothetical protein KatS3mg088_387 [Patescibacteria group bacterium]
MNMEDKQSSLSQDMIIAEEKLQKYKLSNFRLLIIVIITFLLTILLLGLNVYFWQNSASKEMVNNLDQKISSLDEEVSAIKNMMGVSQQDLSLVSSPIPLSSKDINVDWKTYENEKYGIRFKYPSSMVIKKLVTNPDQGVPVRFYLDDRLQIIIKDPKLSEEEITRSWVDFETLEVNGLRVLKEQSKGSAEGGNPPYLISVQYAVDLPKANLFIIYMEPSEGDYKQFSAVLYKIISTLEYIGS